MVKVTIRIPVVRLKRYFTVVCLKRFFRENLGAPFVIAFQVTLLICAFLLIQGYSALADQVAVYGYYSLVVGVVLQLACFIKHGEKAAK